MEINPSVRPKYRHNLNDELNGKNACEICNLAYEKKDLAERCQSWCSKNNSCNLEVAKHSIGEIKRIH